MGTDDPRIGRREPRIGEAELGRLVATQVVHERIRARYQAVQDGLAIGILEIEGERTLVAVERLEDVRVVIV